MSQKIQGGSVFPNPRLSPSGPQLSGEGGPIVQIGFDQMIFDPPPAVPVALPVFALPTPAQIIGAKIPRNTSLPAGPDNVLGVTLRNVRRGNIVTAWFVFGVAATDVAPPTIASFQLCFDDGADGDAGIIGFAVQQVNTNGAGLVRELGSIITLIPNPYDEQRDVRIFPTALADSAGPSILVPPTNQVALIVAEIAKT